MLRFFVIVFALVADPALAQQQQTDPVLLQRAIQTLQAQRNQAMDALANVEVQRATLAEEVAALKAKVQELEKKQAAKE